MSRRGRAGAGADWRYAEAIIDPVLAVAPSFLIDLRKSLQSAGVR